MCTRPSPSPGASCAAGQHARWARVFVDCPQHHHEGRGWGTPGKTFAIGLGCDVQHAQRLVYSKGLDLRNLQAATPIGMGCKVCERTACPQRAFPFTGKPLRVNTDESSFVPYGVGQ